MTLRHRYIKGKYFVRNGFLCQVHKISFLTSWKVKIWSLLSIGETNLIRYPRPNAMSFPPVADFEECLEWILSRTLGRGGGEQNDQTAGQLQGKIKARFSIIFQERKQLMVQYYKTKQCPIQPVNRISKRHHPLHPLQSNTESYSCGLSLRESKK